MINLNFGLWWSGSNLSYLRYLTFKSLRHFHPDAKIQLYWSKNFKKDGCNWTDEKQDFEDPDAIKKNYIEKLKDLDVEVIEVDFFSQYPPNYQSDLFRWWYLTTFGGFYLDTDQIILKSFEELPLDNEFIYSSYPAVSCGEYTPVGVIGSTKGNEFVSYIMKKLPKFINLNNYNSAGPFMLRNVLKNVEWDGKKFNAPSEYFYPIPESYLVSNIFGEGFTKAPRNSFALHWFGGSPRSQEFNKKYDESYSIISSDLISYLLRERGIV